MKIRHILESLHFLLLVMKFRPKIEKIIKKNKKMSSTHNFVDFDDETIEFCSSSTAGTVT